VINNPLKYTDPSGFIFGIGKRLKKWAGKVHKYASNFLKYSGDPGYHFAHSKQVKNFFRKNQWAQTLGYAAARYYGGSFGAAGFSAYLAEINGGSAVDIYKAFALSYLSSVTAGYIGHSGTFKGFAVPVAHGVSQGVFSELGGGSFRSGFWGGFIGAAVPIRPGLGGNGFAGYAIRTTMAAVVGGTAARLGGGKFANGAVSAAFVHMFNDEYTMSQRDPLAVGAPAPVKDSVGGFALSGGVPVPLFDDGEWKWLTYSVDIEYLSVTEDYLGSSKFNFQQNLGVGIGTHNLTVEVRAFSGTLNEYNNSDTFGAYWGVGGGGIINPDGLMRGYSLGYGFGGRALGKAGIPKQFWNKGIEYNTSF
jgi:hypothetical protein